MKKEYVNLKLPLNLDPYLKIKCNGLEIMEELGDAVIVLEFSFKVILIYSYTAITTI